MAKVIEFTYNKKDYVLEYTHKTAKLVAEQGLRLDELNTKPLTMVPMLFAGAFLAHHRFTKQPEIDEIYKLMSNKLGDEDLLAKDNPSDEEVNQSLLLTLIRMYSDAVGSIFDETEGGEGNIEWTTKG